MTAKDFYSSGVFIFNFPNLFHGFDLDNLAEQFMGYQVLSDDAVPLTVKTDVGLGPEDPHRVDALWAYLGSRREPGTNRLSLISYLRWQELSSQYLIIMLRKREYSPSLTRIKHLPEVRYY